jgi:regulator of sigma E protease
LEQQSPKRPDALTPSDAATPPIPSANGVAPVQAPGANAPGSPEAVAPLTPMGWLGQNSPFLVVLIACVGLMYYNTGLDGVIRAAEVVLGLGLVIFIHELGHFLVAKWCNVHVQTFSLGFGPALPGCSFRYGETLYKIAILPLGGYVQMVGEGADADEDENYPRSFKNKTVWQRMLIISAGVFMNVLLACVCFVLVYQFHGMPMPPAIVAATDAGSPAWKEGIPSGAVFTDINGAHDPNFETLKEAVGLSWANSIIHVKYTTRDGSENEEHEAALRPRRDPGDPNPVIGVQPPGRLKVPSAKDFAGYGQPARYHSAAAAARAMDLLSGDVVVATTTPDSGEQLTELKHDIGNSTFDALELCRRMTALEGKPMTLEVVRSGASRTVEVPASGFDFDDVIVGTTDPDHPDDLFNVKTLKNKPGAAEGDHDFFDYQERMKRLAGKPIVVQVLRVKKKENDVTTSTLAKVLVPPAFHATLGLKMKMGEVAAVRDRSPASDKVQPGDVITAATVTAGGAKLGEIRPDDLDPVRLPFALEEAAAKAPAKSSVQVVLTVKRWEGHEQKDTPLTLDWDDRWRFDQELPLSPSSAMALPELGIAYRVESAVVSVKDGSPAAKADLQVNDRIDEISFRQFKKDDAGKWGVWDNTKSQRTKPDGSTEEVYDQWAFYFRMMLQTPDVSGVKVRVWRGGALAPTDFEMEPTEDKTWPLADRGLALLPDSKLIKAGNVVEALGMGLHRTWSSLRQICQGLVSMATGRISVTKNLQGPLDIAEMTFEAARDPFNLILILGIISINLAVMNFLPIPVLDGGHMVFLVYELIRRKPPSDAVRAFATYIGLAFLALLMLFAFYLTFARWGWFGGR